MPTLRKEVQSEAERELERLAGMHPSSAEYSIVRTYLDWLAILPWSKASRDRLDLRRARKVLDADHFDLEKIKERILEYLAVRKLKKDMKGPILCFSGPPGTGKTSLGKSIAKALGREFVRISLGGVHDEAEIRGHRRTYVAALPGRVIQGIRKASTNNPVFMLDEVDKLGADFRGDPSAALLEVLDPEQNSTFRDHYLDVDFDLSKVMFIATANMLETIPSPLLDRLEVLQLPGYSEEEKTHIAQKYIIPKQLDLHGLAPVELAITDAAIRKIIADYTREAGLRNLEREIASICRKIGPPACRGQTERRASSSRRTSPTCWVRRVSSASWPTAPVFPAFLPGLAWTPTGGEILFIEASGMPGKGVLTLTGLLGESMRESAQAALSYLRSHAKALSLDASRFAKTDLHIHVPAGAVPKDGPSAGVAIAAALISLFRDKPIQANLAMTGEVTLTGRVLPGRRRARENPGGTSCRHRDRALAHGTMRKTWSTSQPRSRLTSRSDSSIPLTMWSPGCLKPAPAPPEPTREPSASRAPPRRQQTGESQEGSTGLDPKSTRTTRNALTQRPAGGRVRCKLLYWCALAEDAGYHVLLWPSTGFLHSLVETLRQGVT